MANRTLLPPRLRGPLRSVALAAAALAGILLGPAASAQAALPSGFQDQAVITGLTNPTQVEFAPNGMVFVAEKSGLIKVYDGLDDTSATIFADLRTNTHNFWDRGMLGLELDPQFPSQPYVYVLYTYDAAIGGAAPRWGDQCPTPPGATSDGCVVSGRLSRLTASGETMTGPENVLINDWCQQYPSHSVGDLEFGADGKLYVSGGDGASFGFTDWGQDGSPVNPCGDPPGGVGATLTPPTAEGGALRSQDVRTTSDPTGLDGTILRIDPATGAGLSDNPFAGSSNANARRIVGFGLRNPFRFAMRPGTNEVWIGDVGQGQWEEINVLETPNDGTADNFGWPCYEGPDRQAGYDSANLNLCESLYSNGTARSPYFFYEHPAHIVPTDACPTGTSSISGIDFYKVGVFPSQYHWGLFFADYSRDCISVMLNGGDVPDPAQVRSFESSALNPVDVKAQFGEIYYADFDGGAIRRIFYAPGNQPPTARATASPTSGPAPLTVNFDGRTSSDPEGGALTYAWDLDADGQFDDSTSATPSFTYTQSGPHTATLRVTDPQGASGTAAVTVTVGNSPPSATITAPPASLLWSVGQTISFSGSATDPEQGTLPASAYSWSLQVNHCPSGCHLHPIQSWNGISSGSFVAPDHEYPSSLVLTLTVTDSGGLQATQQIFLNPATATVTLQSSPTGLQLALNSLVAKAPFSSTVILGSTNTVSAPTPQRVKGKTYAFRTWSDGGAQTHNIVASSNRSLTATYARTSGSFSLKAKKKKKKRKKR